MDTFPLDTSVTLLADTESNHVLRCVRLSLQKQEKGKLESHEFAILELQHYAVLL